MKTLKFSTTKYKDHDIENKRVMAYGSAENAFPTVFMFAIVFFLFRLLVAANFTNIRIST
jgi:hypothetical protein